MSASQPQKVLFTWRLPKAFPFVLDSGATSDQTGELMLDASVNENHQQGAEVTKHRVEVGADVTDHVRPLPPKITIEGVVSNAPLGIPRTYNNGVSGGVRQVESVINGQRIAYSVFQFDSPIERVREVYGDLGIAIQGGAVFVITTTLATYETMVCTSFAAQRNAEKGNVLYFTAEFERIIFVQTRTVDALPSRQHRGVKGAQQPPVKKEEQGRKSIADRLAHSDLGKAIGDFIFPR